MEDNDLKIESILKRYRPVGPSEKLKESIFQKRKPRKHNIIWLAAAASIIVVSIAGILILSQKKKEETKPITLSQIEQKIEQAGRPQQLMAIADYFAKIPGGEEHSKELLNEVRTSYPDLKNNNMKTK